MTRYPWVAPSRRLAGKMDDARFDEFKRICDQKTNLSDYPHAVAVEKNIPVYTAHDLLPLILGSESKRLELMDEFHHLLSYGPGVFLVKNMMAKAICARANYLAEEKMTKKFDPAKRVQSFSEKHAKIDPENYAEYYSNPILAAVCEAWLGPNYQITTQSNSIRKGAAQQEIHRDYHLSSMDRETVAQMPLITHVMSQLLTLQCAIAHTDQPLSTGPTCFMPFSNHFAQGYLAYFLPEYVYSVKPRMSQVPLALGDAVFFSPTTFHQPGINETDNYRTNGLFQVNSCMSRPMETKDTLEMTKAVWPVMKRWASELGVEGGKEGRQYANTLEIDLFPQTKGNGRHPLELEALITATCEGYAFPRNMDKERYNTTKPWESMAQLVKYALKNGWDEERLFPALDAMEERRRPGDLAVQPNGH